MTFEEIAANINPEVYQNLKQSLELGKWPNGVPLTAEQKEICMQAIIYYENKRGFDESLRTGFIDRERVEQTSCNSSSDKQSENRDDDVQPLTLN